MPAVFQNSCNNNNYPQSNVYLGSDAIATLRNSGMEFQGPGLAYSTSGKAAIAYRLSLIGRRFISPSDLWPVRKPSNNFLN